MLINDASVNSLYEKMLGMSGFSARQGQVDLMNGATDVFRRGGVCLAEAGTGTGKTHAYLLPGIAVGKETNKKLILSTSNVALQTQLIEKDIPVINKVVGSDIKSAVAKGKGRFICWAKAEKLVSDINVQKLMNIKRDGGSVDFDSIGDDIDSSRMGNLRVNSQCSGRACKYFEHCEYQSNKANVRTADVIITNHSLLLTDLSLGGGILLPKMKDSLVAIDEAHNLPSISINAFSEKHLLSRSIEVLSNMTMFKSVENFSREINLINNSILKLNSMLDEMNMLLEGSENLKKKGMIVYKDGLIPENLHKRGIKIEDETKTLNDRLQFISQVMEDEASDTNNPNIAVLQSAIERGMTENMRVKKVWNLFGEFLEDESPVAKWFKTDTRREDIEVGASVTSASKKLSETLINSGANIVIASATIKDASGFDNFKRECGIAEAKHEIVCSSPFNYRENSRLVVPAMKNEPSDVQGHTNEVASISGKVFKKNEGSLVLFSSKTQMLAVRDILLNDGFDGEILVQGELSKRELIVKHCENVDNGKTSVIFGLDSMYEGVDLKGKYCSTVIISKLPFPSVDDPVFIVQKTYVEKLGKNSFSELIVPYVTRKLVQGVGRLIRTMEDYGDVFILDTRLATKRYGVAMMNQLPDMKKDILVEI